MPKHWTCIIGSTPITNTKHLNSKHNTMNKSESIQEITKAVIKVMTEVKGIEKSMTVGTGNSSYKGVPDQEVKKIIGDSMAKNGLAIFPIGIQSSTKVDRWEATDNYGTKQKQSVFTESTVTYLLTHTSGEFIELSGYGHGVDSQDKSAGKATTYALKYTLLYTFLVPTGKIDDADATHSEQIETPKKKNDEIAEAVFKLANCKTVDELKTFKEILPESVVNSEAFKRAGNARYAVITNNAAIAKTKEAV